MLRFFINDTVADAKFEIEYFTDSFISIKKYFNIDTMKEIVSTFSIAELENLIELLKDFLDKKQYRVHHEVDINTIYKYLCDLRYGK